MALLVGELKSVLDLDTSKYDQGLDRSHDRFKKFVKGAAIASAAAAVAAGAGLLNLAKGAAEDEKAQAILAKTLKNTAKATDAQVASIEAYISKTGAATGVTDDEMRPALANLVRATKDVGKAQSLMGLAMDVSAGTGKDLGAVTQALAKAQNGNVGALGRLGIATKDAHGKTKSFEQIQKDLAKTFKGQSAAAADTTAGKFDRLKLIMAEAGETVGAKVLPVLLGLSTFLLDKVVPAVSGAVSAFAGLGKKVVKAIGPIDLSGISTGIFADTKAWAGAVIGGLKRGIDTGNWQPLGTSLGNGVIRAIQNLGNKSGAILDAIGGLIDKVDWGALGGKISGGITGLFRGIDWKALGGSLGDSVINLVNKGSNLGQKIGTAFKAVINRIDWKQIGNDSTSAIIGFVEGVDWPQVGKALSIAVWKSLKIEKTVYDAVIAGATDLVTGMFWAIIDEMGKFRPWLIAKTKELGGWLWAGLKSGLAAGAKGIGGFIKSVVVDPIVNWAKSLFGIHSPSTVFAGIGSMLMAGLKVGLVTGFVSVARWLRGLAASTVRWVGNVTRTLTQKGRDLISGFWTGLGNRWRDVSSWLRDRGNSAVRWVGSVTRVLYQKGRDVISGFWSGMGDRWRDVTKWVGGIASWIREHKGPVSLDGRLLVPAGQAIMSGFLKGLKSGAGPAWNFVKKVGGKTVDMLRNDIMLPPGVAAGVLGGPNRRVFYQGEAFDLVTYQKLVKAMGMAGAINVTQGGYEGASSYSGTTHMGGGVFDVVGGNLSRILSALKASGLIGWIRNPSQGNWPWHIHALDPSDVGRMSSSARGQVADYYRGGNGLAGYRLGTPWVPNDQMAIVHRGEAIVPEDVNRRARRARGGGGAVVLDGDSIDRLARAINAGRKKDYVDAMREAKFRVVGGSGGSYILQMSNG